MIRMAKAEALARWRQLTAPLPLKPRAIPYKAKGSNYGHDGLRIEGSAAFIESVLSRLTPLLECEGGDTRLAIQWQAVQPRPGKPANGGELVCYVRVHERGPEAKAMNAFVEGIRRRRAA